MRAGIISYKGYKDFLPIKFFGEILSRIVKKPITRIEKNLKMYLNDN